MDLSPLWISLKISLSATVITFILGLFAAWGITYCRKAAFVADSILSVPLVLPPTAVGFILLMILGQNSPLGKLLNEAGLKVIFTWQGAVTAAVVISFPVMYRGIRGAFEQVDSNLVYAARTLGMKEGQILRKIMIPSAGSGIAAAAVLSFARSMGEFGATLMVAGNIPGKTRTMSVAVYTAMQSGDKALAFRWVALIIAISLVILIAMNVLLDPGKRRERT